MTLFFPGKTGYYSRECGQMGDLLARKTVIEKKFREKSQKVSRVFFSIVSNRLLQSIVLRDVEEQV